MAQAHLHKVSNQNQPFILTRALASLYDEPCLFSSASERPTKTIRLVVACRLVIFVPQSLT